MLFDHFNDEQLETLINKIVEEQNRRRATTRQRVAKRIVTSIIDEYGGKFIFEKNGEVVNEFDDFRNRELWIDVDGNIHFEVFD